MATTTTPKTQQYLSFKLGPEIYAFDVSNAREIVECSTITQIPRTPPWVRGVINLRGSVIPVLDLKLKFDMGRTEQTLNTCVIIVESILDGELFMLGVLADAMQEVFELDMTNLEKPPKFGTKISTQYMKGLARRGNDLIIVLDAEQIFSGADLSEAQEIAEQIAPAIEGGNMQAAAL